MTGVMSRHISKTQFKARALELFREVEASGVALVITDRGAPVLELRPYRPRLGDPLEALRGTVTGYAGPGEAGGAET
jgi:antitoxin (DNA-binding transcriptional repressor) of toxin-antitoxin stability system